MVEYPTEELENSGESLNYLDFENNSHFPTMNMSRETSPNRTQVKPLTVEDSIQFIIEKLTATENSQERIEEAMRVLHSENALRAQEIKHLAKQSNMLVTEYGNSGNLHERENPLQNSNMSVNINFKKLSIHPPGNKPTDQTKSREQDKKRVQISQDSTRNDVSRSNSPSPNRLGNYPPVHTTSSYTTSISVNDIIRTIEELKGRYDIGVEDFIKTVKRAQMRCSQPDLLLDFVIAEKIKDQAKRAIRFNPIHNYDQLYSALRQNMGIISSVELSRSKLESIE